MKNLTAHLYILLEPPLSVLRMFLTLKYLFKSTHRCNSSTSDPNLIISPLQYHSTLSEAIDYCNGNAECNCVEFDYRFLDIYSTHDSTTVLSNGDYDAWVISFLSNQAIDRIIK